MDAPLKYETWRSERFRGKLYRAAHGSSLSNTACISEEGFGRIDNAIKEIFLSKAVFECPQHAHIFVVRRFMNLLFHHNVFSRIESKKASK